MARAGVASRRRCEELIAAGRVVVNGTPATLGLKVDPVKDQVLIDGEPLPPPEKLVYIAFNKPRGIISDEDDLGRKTARDYIPIEGHLYPVGRLDKESIGLILLTNDGGLAHRLTHPRYGHEKVYRVKVEGSPENATIARWRRGVDLEDGPTLPVAIKVEERRPDYTWLEIKMREGRKRQIRRVGAALGHPVLHLTRVRIGPVELGDLGLGKWRHLTPTEIKRLKKSTALERPRAGPTKKRRGSSGRRPRTRG